MWKLSLVLLLGALAFEQSEAACGVCNTNSSVACVSKNQFQICTGVTPVTSQNFTCPNADDVCTTNGIFCASIVSGETAKAACRDESNCGVCDDKTDSQFTCTSRTNFAKCSGGKLSEERGECPVGLWCNTKSPSNPCVDRSSVEGDLDKVCDREEAIDAPTNAPTDPPTDTTTQPSTSPPTPQTSKSPPLPSISPEPPTEVPTPSTQPPTIHTEPTIQPPPLDSAEAVCAAKNNAVGRFPYPHEADCMHYVNCYIVYKSADLQCPTGRYFNKQTQTCEANKPIWCA